MNPSRSDKPIQVWHLAVRLMHWTMVGAFAVAWWTRDSIFDQLIHVRAGYVMATVLLLRIAYGFIANDMAAFRRFPPRPIKGLRYMWSLVRGNARNYLGHNPAGALAIYAMLLLGIATVTTGYIAFEYDEEWAKDWHAHFANAWALMVCVHLFGIVAESLAHKEFLVLAMITGYKADREEPFSLTAAGITLLMLLLRLLNLVCLLFGRKGFILRK